MNDNINLQQILSGYEKRSTILGGYYLISEACINRNKFKEFSNAEFFNLMFQVLCFIFEKSIKREKCLKDDIEEYIKKINRIFYQKLYDEENISELTAYIIKSLGNKGKVFEFETYNADKDAKIYNRTTSIKIIEDEHVKVNDKDRLTYSLTNDGFKLLLQTKEYDDFFQINISQMVAKIRLEKGDFEGAKAEILDIINNLEMQNRKMENYLKMVKKDIFHLSKESVIGVLEQSFDTLSSQYENYLELESFIKKLMEEKEKIIENRMNNIDLTKVKKQLIIMKDVLEGIKLAKKASSHLLTAIQNFRIDFDDILMKLLSTASLQKFNFEKEILERIENDIESLNQISQLYKSLCLIQTPNIYNLAIAYDKQAINRKIIEEVKYLEEADFEIVKNEEKINAINKNQDFYKGFMKEFLIFGINNKTFDLKQFFNYFIKNDKNKYMELTKEGNLLREVLLFFVGVKLFEKNKILKDIEKAIGTMQLEFQIELTCKEVFEKNPDIKEVFDSFYVENNIEEITINTEIDLEELTARKLTIPNLKVRFK